MVICWLPMTATTVSPEIEEAARFLEAFLAQAGARRSSERASGLRFII